jgi:hypothetical protein
MKFYLMVVASVMLFIGTASAQHLNIGIKGGVNIYNVHNDNDYRYDSKIGFHAGLIAHIHLADNFALQPEAVYSTQGAEYRNSNSNTKFHLDYINVPFLFQFMFDNGFRLQAGPQIGFLVSAKSKDNDFTVDHQDDINPIDLGIAFGMSYVHNPSGFGIDARYNLGLSNIYENSSSASYNRGFQVGVFYLFKHKS